MERTLALLLLLLVAACGGGGGGDNPAGPISIDAAEGSYPLKVKVASNVAGATDIRWDFGDGSPELQASSAYHVFWAPGEYEITMKGSFPEAKVRVSVKDPVPSNDSALYRLLSETLRAADLTINAAWDGRLSGTLSAGWLLPANNNAGAAMLTPQYWDVTVKYIDAMKALGAKALVVEVNYPGLTPGFIIDPEPYIQYFENVGVELRNRGMLYVVEHNSLLPGYSALPVDTYYSALKAEGPAGKSRWGNERYLEAKIILERIKPDYLVFVEEPTTHDSGLGLTVGEWTFHLQVLAPTLKTQVPTSTALLGAGSGVWEDRRFTENYASIPEFDFVDLHMYPLASPTTNYFTEYLSRLDYLKANAPGKKVLAVEGWLYKASPRELAGGVGAISTGVFAREVYSYWAPLDQRFLEINTKIAHKYGFAMLGMAWTRYYFSYLTLGDPSLSGLTPSQIITKANDTAGLAMLNGKISSTGHTFKQLSQGEGFTR
jgi:hypothetical protein